MKLHDNIKELLENRREKLEEILVEYEARMLRILGRIERVREELNQISKISNKTTYRESCVCRGEPFAKAMQKIWQEEDDKRDKFFKSAVVVIPKGSIITPPTERGL